MGQYSPISRGFQVRVFLLLVCFRVEMMVHEFSKDEVWTV